MPCSLRYARPRWGRLVRAGASLWVYTWAAPWTLLGLLLALPLWLGGARWRWQPGEGGARAHGEVAGGALARRLARWPGLRGFAAITFGHVVLALDADALPALRAHERVHVRQAQRWGPLFGPAYLLAGAWQLLRGRHPYWDNPFERQAYALGGPFGPVHCPQRPCGEAGDEIMAGLPAPALMPGARNGLIDKEFPMSDTQQRIADLVKQNDLVLFMKGSAAFPMCGFSGRAIQILKACGVDPRNVLTVNVLEDEAIRQGIKEYSHWPTIPQLYVKGEFIGGSDIMMEMYESGELQQVLNPGA